MPFPPPKTQPEPTFDPAPQCGSGSAEARIPGASAAPSPWSFGGKRHECGVQSPGPRATPPRPCLLPALPRQPGKRNVLLLSSLPLGGPDGLKEEPLRLSEPSQALPSAANGGQEILGEVGTPFIGEDPSTHPLRSWGGLGVSFCPECWAGEQSSREPSLAERSLAGPGEQEALCPGGSSRGSLVQPQPCVQLGPVPLPRRGRSARHTLVLQVCTPGRLPRGGAGSVGPLLPAWVTQR